MAIKLKKQGREFMIPVNKSFAIWTTGNSIVFDCAQNGMLPIKQLPTLIRELTVLEKSLKV